MKSLLKKLTKLIHPDPPLPDPSIKTTPQELTIVCQGKTVASIKWQSIKKIIAYKYDNFSHDEIYIGFIEDPNNETWLQISEKWEGFIQTSEMMHKQFPAIPENWYFEIMIPAFERKETVLFDCSEQRN